MDIFCFILSPFFHFLFIFCFVLFSPNILSFLIINCIFYFRQLCFNWVFLALSLVFIVWHFSFESSFISNLCWRYWLEFSFLKLFFYFKVFFFILDITFPLGHFLLNLKNLYLIFLFCFIDFWMSGNPYMLVIFKTETGEWCFWAVFMGIGEVVSLVL